MSVASATHLVFYFTAGAALGALYFVLLLRSVRLHAAQTAALRVAPLHFLRLAAAVSGFWLIAQRGALPLLFALLGFLLARFAVRHWAASD